MNAQKYRDFPYVHDRENQSDTQKLTILIQETLGTQGTERGQTKRNRKLK